MINKSLKKHKKIKVKVGLGEKMKTHFRAIENIDLLTNNIKSKFGKNQGKYVSFGLTGITAALSGRQCISKNCL